MIHGRYSTLYQYYKYQIEFGYIPYQGSLPTMELLHEVFHCSLRSVRSAYQLLQKEGYISLSSGRKTIVTFKSSAEECRRRSQEYYLARRNAFDSLTDALIFILLPLLREGCRNLQKEDLETIKEMAVNLDNGNFYVAYYAARQMLLAIHNPLAIALYDEIACFYQFSHLLYKRIPMPDVPEKLHQLTTDVITACSREDRDGLYHIYLDYQNLLDRIIKAYIRLAETECAVPEQIPFGWNVYRDHSQLCYTLAAQLISRIYITRELHPGEFLPSYHALSCSWAVSLSTVRRTIALLEQLGMVTPLHGVGTQVAGLNSFSILPDSKVIQRNISMLSDVLQMILLTLEPVIQIYFPKDPRCTEKYILRIRSLPADKHSFVPFFFCLVFLFYESPNSSLRAIGEKLCETLLLCLPLLESQAQLSHMTRQLVLCSHALLESLETGNSVGFLDGLKETALLAARTAAELLSDP